MTIPKKILEAFNVMRETSDISELMALTGKSKATIYNIFNTGECSLEDFEVFKGFYDARKQKLKELLK